MSRRPVKHGRVRVLRIYHGGRLAEHRARERALVRAGIDVTLVVPERWSETGVEPALTQEEFRIVEFPVRRSGDVNRHAYADTRRLASVIREVAPRVLDLHEEPFSITVRQWLRATPPDLPVVMYAAQNVDKRFPPPFAQYETAAYRRVAALYPCSSQAAAVARSKGYRGPIEVVPLGYDETVFRPGDQSLDDDEVVIGLFGRLVPEKGVRDAVEILARLNRARPTRLVVVGQGVEERAASARAARLGLSDRLEVLAWQPASELAKTARQTHVVLVPSRPTTTWVEQFGRVVVEAQASGAIVAGYASGAIPEVAGETAILTGVGDVGGLGDRIAALLSDPAEYARRRQEGIELSRSRTWARVAAKQADLYRLAIERDRPAQALPRSPRRRRQIARAEFGPPASTTAGERPFALPLLRRGGRIAGVLAGALDAGAELVARAREASPPQREMTSR